MSWEAIAAVAAAFTLPTIGFIFTLGKVWNKFEQSEREKIMLWNTVNASKADINGLGAKINKVDAARRKLAIAVITEDKAKLVRSAEE
jgi:hypothetical protein